MADRYPSYTAMVASGEKVEGVDYTRTVSSPTGATYASIAIHSGAIEAGSGEVAQAVADGLMRRYDFSGIQPSNNFDDLHITSTNFDDPSCLNLIATARRVLSFHGYVGPTGIAETAIGGLDTEMVGRITAALQGAGFRVVTAPSEIAGTDPANICNKGATGAGVQIEMSRALRESFFPDGDTSRTMRESGQRTAAFEAYVNAIRSAYIGRATISLSSTNNSRWTLVGPSVVDSDIEVSFGVPVLATGGGIFVALTARWLAATDCLLARAECTVTQSMILTVRKRVGNVESLITQFTVPGLTHTTTGLYRLRFQVVGTALRAKLWDAVGSQPNTWHIDTTHVEPALAGAGRNGTRTILSTTNTNALPVQVFYRDWQVNNGAQVAQALARGIDRAPRDWPAGTEVNVWSPAYAAL